MSKSAVILGVMSGTSLDGLDFALCKFFQTNEEFKYEILKAGFFEYPADIKKKLVEAQNLSAFNFVTLHKDYGRYIGKKAKEFIKDTIKPDFIASHGHTIFHKPEENISFQIGDGAFIAAETKISVISDFRKLDTALNGQGAPLVPVGDKYLFSDYDFCLNLGGFANISYEKDRERIAFDICPVNFILNDFSRELGAEYDKNGKFCKQGIVNNDLLKRLNDISYYSEFPPKSLGREYVEKYYNPLIDNFDISVKDKLRTFCKHIAVQINNSTKLFDKQKILITGGGTHNSFLISEIIDLIKHKVIIPDIQIIDYKEAIIFAFLGFLRISNIQNTLKSVTGANSDSIGGSIFIYS